jgi:hypothetical protein
VGFVVNEGALAQALLGFPPVIIIPLRLHLLLLFRQKLSGEVHKAHYRTACPSSELALRGTNSKLLDVNFDSSKHGGNYMPHIHTSTSRPVSAV